MHWAYLFFALFALIETRDGLRGHVVSFINDVTVEFTDVLEQQLDFGVVIGRIDPRHLAHRCLGSWFKLRPRKCLTFRIDSGQSRNVSGSDHDGAAAEGRQSQSCQKVSESSHDAGIFLFDKGSYSTVRVLDGFQLAQQRLMVSIKCLLFIAVLRRLDRRLITALNARSPLGRFRGFRSRNGRRWSILRIDRRRRRHNGTRFHLDTGGRRVSFYGCVGVSGD